MRLTLWTLPVLFTATVCTVACGGGTTEAPASSAASASTASPAASPTPGLPANAPQPTPVIEAQTKALAALGPHTQAQYPPIPFEGYPPPRPAEVVKAAYQFAAEHPEVASYVPCFCGCQNGGHKGNHDCFVRSRAANGDVLEWEPHGLECAVCIDVATLSRQLLASGASVQEIRASVEKEFGPSAQTMTPTPKPPTAHTH